LFLNSYTVIGQESDLKKCILGLDLTKRAIVTAELFIVIWKSMYDLVYFVEQSRISEKMLEKAFLLHADEQAVKDIFTIDRFIMTNDENILTDVKKLGPDIERFLAIEDPKRLYLKKYEIELNKKNFRMTNNFLAKLENTDELADQLSVQLCSELKFGKYDIICDIIKSKAPREIYLENPDIPDQEAELRDESDVVGVINAKNNLKVYVSPKILKDLDVKQMRNVLKKMVEEEVELG
jgi:HD superfamily phosphohydrolase